MVQVFLLIYYLFYTQTIICVYMYISYDIFHLIVFDELSGPFCTPSAP
jgi:hypothetical protein